MGYLFTNVATDADKINLVWKQDLEMSIIKKIVAPIIESNRQSL